jgi:hypothetical protein
MKAHSKYRISCEFDYNGEKYLAWLCPYYELTDREMEIYQVTEYSYVAHLFSMAGFKTFEMFPGDDLKWTTNAPRGLVEGYVVEVLNYVLVNAFK